MDLLGLMSNLIKQVFREFCENPKNFHSFMHNLPTIQVRDQLKATWMILPPKEDLMLRKPLNEVFELSLQSMDNSDGIKYKQPSLHVC